MFHSYYLYLEVAMKAKVANLVNDSIKDLNVYVYDASLPPDGVAKIGFADEL